jgi:hypothetical protein
MGSRLANVRLDPDRLRKVERLRERGVSLSDVLRQAIDDRWSELAEQRDVGDIVARMFEQYPDPPDLLRRDYDVHNRHAARAAILRRQRRARR